MLYRHFDPGLAAGVAGAFGVGFFLYGQSQAKRAKKTLSWRPVDGQITSVEIEERMSGGRNPHMRYRANIQYTYTIGTHQRLGNCVRIGDNRWHDSDSLARDAVNRFSPGDRVKVYVNLGNPAETVLIPGDSSEAQHTTYVALACGVGAILLLLFRNALTMAY